MGTSGWLYDWNEGGSIDWYLRYTNLNAVELNASFYRFPYPNQVVGWSKKMRSIRAIRWAIKVHRSITHLQKLGEKSLNTWSKFYALFSPMSSYIDFYLFQMPPNFKKNSSNIEKIVSFVRATNIGEKAAIEFRDPSWFNNETVELCRQNSITLVSVDSPMGTWITSSTNILYLRLHGRTTWYSYEYSLDELREIASKIAELKPGKVYVFFNNDHWMLENAKIMLELLSRL